MCFGASLFCLRWAIRVVFGEGRILEAVTSAQTNISMLNKRFMGICLKNGVPCIKIHIGLFPKNLHGQYELIQYLNHLKTK